MSNVAYSARIYAIYLSVVSALGYNQEANMFGNEWVDKEHKKMRLHSRRGISSGQTAGVAIAGVIALFLIIIIAGNILPTGLGTIANSSKGTAMTNVDAGTKSLYGLLGLFVVIGVILLILKSTGILKAL